MNNYHVTLDCGCSTDISTDDADFLDQVWVNQKGVCGHHGIIKIKEINEIAKT